VNIGEKGTGERRKSARTRFVEVWWWGKGARERRCVVAEDTGKSLPHKDSVGGGNEYQGGVYSWGELYLPRIQSQGHMGKKIKVEEKENDRSEHKWETLRIQKKGGGEWEKKILTRAWGNKTIRTIR